MPETQGQPIDVAFVLPPHALALDWAGPAETFRMANRRMRELGQEEAFALRFLGPAAQAVSSVGVTLAGLEPLPERWARPTWLVLVGIASDAIEKPSAALTSARRATRAWLSRQRIGHNGLERLLTICSGALQAAEAGLLRGISATTHHEHLQALATADPHCKVQNNRVYVKDGAVYSSAGVTTGIDLALHLVAERCGAHVAAHVAQALVVALRRGPQDPELSPFLAHRNHMNAALHRAQDAVMGDLHATWSLPRMASCAHVSERQLSRLFSAHAGTSAQAWVQGVRLAAAQAALRAGRNVTQAAATAGFGSDAQLRRAWHQAGLEGSPSRTAPL